MARDHARRTPANVSNESPNLEQIRLRAYELYEERGREDGHDIEDWLRAEEEITKMNARAASA